ncbi:hypothetical protein ACHAXR_009593 [Thalassiosira sp. AJA248-18]
MENAIDFQELRRREWQRIRSSKNKSNVNHAGRLLSAEHAEHAEHTEPDESVTTARNNNEKPPSSHQEAVISSQSNTCTCSLSPYVSVLHQNKLSEDLHRIVSPTKIDSVFYAQHFLSSVQAQEIMSWLDSIPEYSQHVSCVRQTEREESLQHNGKWTRLKHARRNVALFDGTICNLPPILQRLSNTLVAIGAFPSSHPPNHVLINEYKSGEGIMPHTDGPAYESRTATISLGGSDVIFKLWPRQHHDTQLHSATTQLVKNPSLEVILHGNGSLVLFSNDAYLNHCHGIQEGLLEETTSMNGVCGNDAKGGTLVKRGYRISLTFRCKKLT